MAQQAPGDLEEPRPTPAWGSKAGRRPTPNDETIYREIYDAIVDHRLPPGTKLTEDALGEVFGVSRTRINKVLQRLAQEQIVALQRNRGASVARPTVEEAREVFAARRLIEAETVRLAAAHREPAALERLDDNLREEAEALANQDPRAMIEHSGRFHLTVAEMAGNRTLARFLKALVARTSLIIAVYERPGGSPCDGDEHRMLRDLIAAGEADAAATALIEHLSHIEAGLDFDQRAAKPTDLAQVFNR